MQSGHALEAFVGAIHVGGPDQGGDQPILPDAHVDILREPGRGPWVAGPDTGPAPSSVPRGGDLVRVQFRRGRAAAILGCDLVGLRDQRRAGGRGSHPGRRSFKTGPRSVR